MRGPCGLRKPGVVGVEVGETQAVTGSVQRAREAFARQAWGDAYLLLAPQETLDADDLQRLAVAAHLVGRDDESVSAWDRAHRGFLRGGDPDGAACCLSWLALNLMLRGDVAQASGWYARAARLLDDAGVDGAARGYLRLPVFMEAVGRGDLAAATELAEDMAAIGRRCADPDLQALGGLTCGEAALVRGDVARAMDTFDEVMLAVAAGEISPIPAGIVYCAVIEACLEAFDIRRATEWTDALSRWCAAQSDLVPYRGQCLVHRSQVLQARGDWSAAIVEADRAARWLGRPAHPALGLALYQQGELHRLRGEFDAAELGYRAASEHGRDPAPGMALLRLAEGDVDAAVVGIRRMVEESVGRRERPTIVAAAVEIHLAAGDVGAARHSADELLAAAAVPFSRAVAGYAIGSVQLAEGDAVAAVGSLRTAAATWRDLAMPYEEARCRVQVARCCHEMGDAHAAALELDAAVAVFERLGARVDLKRARHALATRHRRDVPLTGRECEVLRLVAAGKSNRQIAGELVISEHTVARHLQNMFLKLGLSSRTAATAYAYEHDLV